MNTASPILPVQERRKDRIEAWVHPTTGYVSIVRITRDAQGFGVVDQLMLIPPNQPVPSEFGDCQFAPLA
jgi:hypothetical protein